MDRLWRTADLCFADQYRQAYVPHPSAQEQRSSIVLHRVRCWLFGLLYPYLLYPSLFPIHAWRWCVAVCGPVAAIYHVPQLYDFAQWLSHVEAGVLHAVVCCWERADLDRICSDV